MLIWIWINKCRYSNRSSLLPRALLIFYLTVDRNQKNANMSIIISPLWLKTYKSYTNPVCNWGFKFYSKRSVKLLCKLCLVDWKTEVNIILEIQPKNVSHYPRNTFMSTIRAKCINIYIHSDEFGFLVKTFRQLPFEGRMIERPTNVDIWFVSRLDIVN